eukprot:CAMPEP_0172673314 /NCGR_PEP_ID=MMETSP1074-20121228/12070_1 /TAXON_ID=2916 /ORGANISM="Ceratium fusus, Strain PA161109" /LENGTH=739 /DNA_ID=CAMNT_0013490593 /DNA_START=123 /DNA_END=2342 /DNA_ORIENTATION=-
MSFSLSLTRLWPALRFSWLAFLVLFIGLRLLQDWIRRDLLLPEFAVYAHASVAATPAVPTIHATPLATGTAAGPDVGPVASPTGSPASPAKNAARPTPGGMMPQTKRLSRIGLWVQDLDQAYLYMMEAFYSTLMSGFTVACNRGAWQLDFQVVKRQAFPAAIEKVGFQKGDVFVWIGFHYAPEIDWQRLRHKGVYTIYVDTEGCPPKVDSDEIWLFHWMSFDRCPLPNRPMYRYVPTGFRPNRASAVHLDYRPKVNLFECVQCRVGCWGELRRQFGASLQTNSGVWVADDTTFANYIKTRSVFVTVPKVCAEGMYVPAARISDLLSSGVFIISLRSYPDDERMFRGLVNFTEFDKMGAVYQRIANMSGQERQRMAATIRSEYAKRFAPSVIFERANIYALLDSLRRGLPPPPDPQLQLRRQRQHQQQQQQQAGSKKKRRICVWSGQPANQTEKKGYDYLLSPFLTTLLQGLIGSHWLNKWTLDVRALTTEAVAHELDRASLQQREVFVWVGIEGEKAVQWMKLRQRGVHTIFYRNEGCDEAASPRGFHELWYPEWRLISTCSRSPNATVRRVPTGFLPGWCMDGPPSAKGVKFVGWWPRRKPSCEEPVGNVLGANAEIVHTASREDFKKIGRTGSIFVTWPEICLSGRFVHASQLSTLLSCKLLVVSVRPYVKDEAEYRDFVTLASPEKLLAESQKLARMSVKQRKELAFNRSSEFAYKFNPARILQKAGLFSLLRRLQ